MVLIATVAMFALSAVWASGASANKFKFEFRYSIANGPYTVCDAQFDAVGRPPSNVTLLGATFAGDPNGPSGTPCVPGDLAINNNPVVSFSGSYTGTINQIDVDDLAVTGCTFRSTNTSITSSVNVKGLSR